MNDPDPARELGEARNRTHPNGTPRFFSDPNEENVIGAAGELEFARLTGLVADPLQRAGGDGGIDFRVGDLSIDVKTSRKPSYLLLRQDKIHQASDVLVLAGYRDHRVTMLGWEFSSELLRCPTRDFGYGIVSHHKPCSELRPMVGLYELIRQTEEPSGEDQSHWVTCPGGCDRRVPPGQQCFECAAAAVSAWKNGRLRAATKNKETR